MKPRRKPQGPVRHRAWTDAQHAAHRKASDEMLDAFRKAHGRDPANGDELRQFSLTRGRAADAAL